ncbi:hypothetical protein B0T26DRAFT_700077 [Lasiosphaeria miniovina]|uniref:Stress response RCI peptide n=1 Tax=Lasiosphaeria miniovina TaxID=1954250 RepID=A0AA40E1Q0_9PEZI|nr:uncharacterized protein B0T26DRAFT_700077 [Lasiosphaeria miniovina]KAK0721702.1 hypothetical protein B0T26DRAFT_700077 [Lasiosphaeria miniovina]
MIIMCSSDIFLGLLAILFPPLAVWVKRGICSGDSVINVLLCFLGYVPGLIHAWYIIAKYPDPTFEYGAPQDSEGGHIYVFVHDGGRPSAQRQEQQQPRGQPKPQAAAGNLNYGTTAANKSGASAAALPAPAPSSQVPQDAGEGPSDGAPPPSYAQVVAGDNKIQTQD